MRTLLFALLGLTIGAPAAAAEEEVEDPAWAGYEAFAKARSGRCVGKKGTLPEPIEFEVGGHRYRIEGHRMVQLDEDRDRVLRIGVISATKDDRELTLEAIATLIRRLEKRKMDVLLVNGDVATHEINVDEAVFPAYAKAKVPVIVLAGNTESCGYFNQAATKTFEAHRHFVNGNWVRQIELDDGVMYTLPGYHDRRFVHTGGAAHYDEDDLYELRRMIRAGPGPKILVAHGPPRMKGKRGIDIASGAGHVGDPKITEVLKGAEVSFGIFGHILEAGGRGSDLSGRRGRRPGRWYRSLYVNAGTANTDPWMMLNGKTSYGMGMLVEVRGEKARYRVLRLPRPR